MDLAPPEINNKWATNINFKPKSVKSFSNWFRIFSLRNLGRLKLRFLVKGKAESVMNLRYFKGYLIDTCLLEILLITLLRH